jgi:hypothetical protein
LQGAGCKIAKIAKIAKTDSEDRASLSAVLAGPWTEQVDAKPLTVRHTLVKPLE